MAKRQLRYPSWTLARSCSRHDAGTNARPTSSWVKSLFAERVYAQPGAFRPSSLGSVPDPAAKCSHTVPSSLPPCSPEAGKQWEEVNYLGSVCLCRAGPSNLRSHPLGNRCRLNEIPPQRQPWPGTPEVVCHQSPPGHSGMAHHTVPRKRCSRDGPRRGRSTRVQTDPD